jgi:hypothetical protein
MIDREPVESVLHGPSGSTPTPTNTATVTPTTPASGSSTTSGSGSTTVASNTGTGTIKPGVPPIKITNGSATLDWTPPTENADGSVLTNLAGYTVYYGTAPDQLTKSVKLTNPGLTAYTVTNLPSGTWYFAVTSYSAAGVESARSGVISTKI